MSIQSQEVSFPAPEVNAVPAQVHRWKDVWRLVAGNRKASAGLIIVGFFVLLAIFGPIILRQDPHTFTTDILQPPSATHWFGTTNFGVDVLLSLVTNVFLVLPTLPLAILLAAFLPNKGPLAIGFVLVITGWSWGARVLRSQTLTLRNRDCVEAARASGESTWRIIFYEILPNQTSIVAAQFFGTVIYVILAETALEYLGLGDITAATWGNMLFSASNNSALLLGAWWWFLPPGLCIAILGAALTFVNFGIDEISNPRLRKESKPRGLKAEKQREVALPGRRRGGE